MQVVLQTIAIRIMPATVSDRLRLAKPHLVALLVLRPFKKPAFSPLSSFRMTVEPMILPVVGPPLSGIQMRLMQGLVMAVVPHVKTILKVGLIADPAVESLRRVR